jgi:glycerol-3-phosphate dehydrogenase (NAD(P)+)
MKQVIFIGSGAIATALGNILAGNQNNHVQLLSIEEGVVSSINGEHVNKKYFPNFRLDSQLTATTDREILLNANFIFLAIPSVTIVNYLKDNAIFISKKAVIVNLAKGFGCDHNLIPDCLDGILPNTLCSLKGPSFAREIINNQPTSFTLGAKSKVFYNQICSLFDDTNIYVDFSSDIRGVELLSILKNIYAIVIGIVDAQFESPNLKFMLFTKALAEMRKILLIFGGSKKTLFNYCGIGDFALTSLNDLSRNRTLGLLIGKGFFTDNISDKVVLEGRIAVDVFYEELKRRGIDPENYPIIDELHKVFNQQYDISSFVVNLLKK